MSAIAGIVNFNENAHPLEQGSRLMAALSKLPADDVQVWHKENVFLGCHAQWITPESAFERLPHYDSPRRLAITADAIIDNRQELFDRLYVDHERRSKMPDSELILLAYHKWGTEAPKFLAGDFAFVIWDERNRLVFGARDFSGTRTLYFRHDGASFEFCTLMRPLLALQNDGPRLNEEWIAEYLASPWRTETVEVTSTVYKDIRQIPPGHSLTVRLESAVLERYSAVTDVEPLKLKSDQEYEEAFRDVFQQAVRSQLRTKRNVGALLSGGLDSGTVASFAAKELEKENKQLYSFSYIPIDDFVNWTGKRLMPDERPFIQLTVRHVGNIKDHYLSFNGKSWLTEVDEWLDVLEMPYKSYENSFWIKGIHEEAREQGVGVILNGARGNSTISWGPAADYYAMLLKRLKWVRLYKEVLQYSHNTGASMGRIAKVIGRKAFPSLASADEAPNRIPVYINPEFAQRTGVFQKLQQYNVDLSGRAQRNSNMYAIKKEHFENPYVWSMTGTMSAKVSLRNSMASRDPTNDLRVVRFCLSVPEEQYVKDGMDRALLRRSTRNYLPDQVRLNQRVRGIQAADGVQRISSHWTALMEELHQLSNDPAFTGYINAPLIKECIGKLDETLNSNKPHNVNYIACIRSLILYRFLKRNGF